jgi:hypothetical protein
LNTGNNRVVRRKQEGCTQEKEGLYTGERRLYTGNRRVVHRNPGGMYIVPSQEDTCTQETRRLFKGKRRFVLRKKKGCTQERWYTGGRKIVHGKTGGMYTVQCTQAR